MGILKRMRRLARGKRDALSANRYLENRRHVAPVRKAGRSDFRDERFVDPDVNPWLRDDPTTRIKVAKARDRDFDAPVSQRMLGAISVRAARRFEADRKREAFARAQHAIAAEAERRAAAGVASRAAASAERGDAFARAQARVAESFRRKVDDRDRFDRDGDRERRDDRDKDCKERPKDNRRHSGSGHRKFVPWCGAEHGANK